MFEKTITTTTTNPLGAQAEIEKHRIEAAKTLTNPQHVGTNSTSLPTEDGNHIYTITTHWKEGDPE